ncbi:TPA: hypothetical protein I8Y83_002749 [Legionella pneumophila]|uniref:Uncharacterized protein n=1 Tax=Legionella bozemanae TaxID=447 RepID=A0A0W0RER1_LEGBO|nr:hypothetical protein [Legionella bozemanae]KTC69576.1 hypothetical protein Lboz_3092 [Legionella bozemanae]STP13854.1 Uncharacterised protein [Legionella bozemanae]HAT1722198.1 hypothetical protein [Legionella pneumophila]
MTKIDSHFMKKNLGNKVYPLYGGVSRLKNDSILNKAKFIIDTGCESNLTILFLSENRSAPLKTMPGKGPKE